MKRVLREVVDKNGATELVFTPTAQMIAYSLVLSRNKEESNERICDLTGISRNLPALWRRKYGSHFNDWLEEALEFELNDEAGVLERFGMMQALQPGNFQYFREMARVKGVIKDDVKTQNITINTDFKAIVVAAGGDLNEARKRLLEQSRGLVVASVQQKPTEKKEDEKAAEPALEPIPTR